MKATLQLQKRAAELAGTENIRISNSKLRAVELAAQAHTLSYIAAELGVTRQTMDNWRNADAGFDDAMTYALREAAADYYESNLRKQSDDGNVTATIVGLKMKGRYVERSENLNANLNMNVAPKPQYDYERAYAEAPEDYKRAMDLYAEAKRLMAPYRLES